MAKWTKKKKIIAITSAVLVVAVVGTGIGVSVAKKNAGPEIQLQTIGTEDIQSSINATADVEAGATKEYKVNTLAKVTEVFVKEGDRVTEGQILATFDTSALDQQIGELQRQYNNTAASYKTSLAAAEEAKSKLAAVDAQIAELEAKIAAAQNTTEATTATPEITLPAFELPEEVMDQIQAALEELAKQGDLSSESIRKAIEDVLNQAIQDGLISGDLLPDINSGFDSMMGGMNDEMQLANLKIQRQIQEITASSSLTETTKSLMKTTADTIETLKEQRAQLSDGWTADFNGIITKVNVTPGGETTLLQPGIVLQGTDVMTAVITLGKYDIQKVRVGMPCTISVVNGTYSGEVSYIAPTADSGSAGSEILDQMSSSFGISGLGSLTGSSTGVRCEITIFHPDEKVIIGLDANVEIGLEQREDAVALPVECLKMDKEGKYVFLYDEETKTVVKQPVTLGISSDLYYEVTEGLKKGDKIAASELSTLEDGQRVTVSTKTTKKK